MIQKQPTNIVRLTLLVFILLIGSQHVFAAAGPKLAFERTWGGTAEDTAEGVAIAGDGNVYVAGTTFSFGVGETGDSDAFLLKYASDGTLTWQRTWGTPRTDPGLSANEIGKDVAVSSDNLSIYITGIFPNLNVFLVKFDADGNLVWERTWGNGQDFAEAVAVAQDGSIYVTGRRSSSGAGSGDVFLVKFNSEGTFIWDRTWGGANPEVGSDVAVAADGSVYVAGDGNSFFGNDAVLLKFNPDGILLWERDWREGTIQDLSAAFGVAVAADGSVYMTGLSNISGVKQDVFLVKFNPDGSLVWQKTWGGDVDTGQGVAVASNGRIFVTGNTGFGAGNGDAFVVEFSPSGKTRSAKTWGGLDHESGQSIAVGPDGNIYVAGAASAPPYVFGQASKSSNIPNASVNIPVGTITEPLAPVGVPTGTVQTPNGSQTFAGVLDAMLLKIVP